MTRIAPYSYFRGITAGALTCVALATGTAQNPELQRPREMRALTLLQTMQVANAPQLAPVINALLSDTNAHMRMAPARRQTRADVARARVVATTARAALMKYTDVSLAEQDGYQRFLPWLEDQDIYHYNNIQNVMISVDTFDVTRPVSLLYRKNKAKKLVLVGAMYSALPGATSAELDARLPISVAHWHEHVNFCAPRPDSVRAGAVPTDSATLTKWLKITSSDRCNTAGGIFLPRLFGWMAHAYLFGKLDTRSVWGGEQHDHMKMPSMPGMRP